METGARIYFEAFDETAARDAAFSSLGQSWVDYGELTDGMYPDDPNEDPGNPTLRQYVTGEQDAVRLDRGFRLFPDAPGLYMGYWSAALSEADGGFSAPPVLLCDFGGALHTSVGITLHFDVSTHLSDFTVQWFGADGATLAAKEVAGNTARTVFVEQHMEDYAQVRILCQKTDAPFRYVKIQEIEFGERMVYDNSTLVSASVTEEVDLSGASVPAGSLRFTLLDPDGRLDPVNPTGIYAYLRRGMRLHVDFLLDGASSPGGLYYLDAWECSNPGAASMTALDIVGIYAKQVESPFYNQKSPQDILGDIGAELGVDTAAYGLPVSSLTGYIPAVSLQEALAHLCVSAGGFAHVGRGGVLSIDTPSISPEAFAQGEVLGEPSVSKVSQPDTIEIEVSHYTVSDIQEGMGFGATSTLGDFRLVETYPFLDDTLGTQVDVQLSEGAKDYWVYSDRISVSYEAGGAMSCTYRPVIFGGTSKVLSGGTRTETLSLEGIPLITQGNVQVVMATLQAHYSHSLRVKFRTPWRDGLDCGACVSVPTRFGEVTGHVTKLDIDLTGGLLAAVEVLA